MVVQHVIERHAHPRVHVRSVCHSTHRHTKQKRAHSPAVFRHKAAHTGRVSAARHAVGSLGQ